MNWIVRLPSLIHTMFYRSRNKHTTINSLDLLDDKILVGENRTLYFASNPWGEEFPPFLDLSKSYLVALDKTNKEKLWEVKMVNGDVDSIELVELIKNKLFYINEVEGENLLSIIDINTGELEYE